MIDKPDFVEMSGDLPSGWEERTSRSTGQTYFLNQVDNHLHFLAIATLDSYSCSSQNSRHGTGQLSQPQRLQLRCGLISSNNHLGLWKVRGSHLLVKHKDSRRPASWRQDPITRTKVVPQHSTLNFSHKHPYSCWPTKNYPTMPHTPTNSDVCNTDSVSEHIIIWNLACCKRSLNLETQHPLFSGGGSSDTCWV